MGAMGGVDLVGHHEVISETFSSLLVRILGDQLHKH